MLYRHITDQKHVKINGLINCRLRRPEVGFRSGIDFGLAHKYADAFGARGFGYKLLAFKVSVA